MSAYGPKQTWKSALHMSAFGGKADIAFLRWGCLFMTNGHREVQVGLWSNGFADRDNLPHWILALSPALFRNDPEPQGERNQRHRADAAEPECCEPQQALRERARIPIGGHQ